MNNPFICENANINLNAYNRLVSDYKKHGKLLIAVDYDNTVCSFPDMEPYADVIELIKKAKSQGHTLILFTANEGEKLKIRVEKCIEWGIKPDYINESPVMETIKPYYNIFLDDRAGLSESYMTLNKFLENQNTIV